MKRFFMTLVACVVILGACTSLPTETPQPANDDSTGFVGGSASGAGG